MEEDPFAPDDTWNNAISALGGIADPDPGGVAKAKPDARRFAELLLSDMPMPRSARKTLAELCAPGDPPIMNWRLVPESIKEIDPIATQLKGAAAYWKNISDRMTKGTAADQTGVRGGKQIKRYVELLESLGRRLRGEDP
jgi:hypothetical protein